MPMTISVKADEDLLRRAGAALARFPVKFFRRGDDICGVATVQTGRGTFKFAAVVPFAAVKSVLDRYTAKEGEKIGLKIGEDLNDAIAYDAARRACRAEIVKCIRSRLRDKDGNVGENIFKKIGKGVASVAKAGVNAAATLTKTQLAQVKKGAEYSLQKYAGEKLPIVKQLVDNVPPSDAHPDDAADYGKFAASVINHAKKGDPSARLAIRQVTSAARAGDPQASEAAAAMESVAQTLKARDDRDTASARDLGSERGRGSGVKMFAGRFPHTNETVYLTDHYRAGLVAGLRR